MDPRDMVALGIKISPACRDTYFCKIAKHYLSLCNILLSKLDYNRKSCEKFPKSNNFRSEMHFFLLL